MRKIILVIGATVALIAIAVYVTNNYNLNDPLLEAKSTPLVENSADNATTNNEDHEILEAASSDQGNAQSSENSSAEPALDFTLLDLEGNEVSLQNFRGKNVYLNFWATWCKWCVQEMPDMETIYWENVDNDLVILAVDVGEDSAKVEKYIEERGYPFQVLLDPDKSVAKAYHIRSIPVSIFIDRDGYIAYQRVGAMNEEQMRAAIASLE